MAAVTEATLDQGSRQIIQRYFLAMAAPFAIDVGTSAIYVLINAQPLTLVPMASVSAVFLLLGVGACGWMLIRPVQRFLAGELSFTQIEVGLASLPRNSAIVIGCLYTPMLALRLLSPRVGITFGATIEIAAWIDTICSFLVVSAFNVVLSYFIISAYLDRLCEFLFRTRGVNLGIFRGKFRRRIGLAVLFVSFAAMTLLAGDIASYEGNRLLREATNDLVASIVGAAITYFWITRALTRPIARLDHGMRQVAAGDLAARLPVTSDDEVGRATAGFNQMVEGLAEREYLRDTFGKYVSESVAAAILGDHERRGRVANTLAEATLMFTDIEGFTTLSETLKPADVASVLNTYLGTVVPAIERHGGVVNNFIGDGLFASFNLPLPQDNHAAAAIQAAIEIQRALAAKSFAAGVRLRTRIGINTGPVVGVTIGTENRLNYTLLGDAVNIAARVEQLNKQFGTLIMATESTVRAAGEGFPCTRLGETGVRGHRGDVVVYRIDPSMTATTTEIAALRRRYLWMAVSIFFLDLAISLIFRLVNGGWDTLWISAGPSVVLLLAANWVLARYQFEPIHHFLKGQATFESAERRLTQLPLVTARWVFIFGLIVCAFRNSLGWWLPGPTVGLGALTIADFVAVTLILPIFYFTYTYFVVSDYLSRLCGFIFERYGYNLGLFFGSYTLKLVVALLVISVAPLTAIVVDLFSYSGERQQVEILVDVASAVFGVAITAYYIGRSLLQPIGILSRAMTKVAAGDLEVRVPVTSNDEVGELTGRFNTMVEGLREREKIRETFGRYVDESVAATILRRQGEGARSGETAEATILFTDIAGFTTIAEYLTPAELVGALNDYLETVLEPIRAHGGVVNTFIGDGLFASFNMPLACEGHAVAAVRAAIDIQRAVGSRTFGDQGVALATRIGISTGPVIGGDVGTGRRTSFTLLGDTVNLAARLEELNKQHGTRILVSESTREACGECFAFNALGSVQVRGRTETIAVYAVDPNVQEMPS